MVARDGIEPPTPAFSGPRSTTELSGLSANYKLKLFARIPASPEMVGESSNTALQNNLNQYSNSHSPRQTAMPIWAHVTKRGICEKRQISLLILRLEWP